MQEIQNRTPAKLFENCPWENSTNISSPKPQIQSVKPEGIKINVDKSKKIKNIEGMKFSKDNFEQLKQENISVQDQLDQLISGFEYFGINYELAKDIFTEQNLTIHQVKARTKKAYESNSFLQVSVNYLLNVLMGDKPGIRSEDDSIEIYGKKWMHFSGKKKADRESMRQAIISGDGYTHKLKGEKGTFKYRAIQNAEDMYIDWDYKNNRPIRYIERLYFTEATAKKLGLKTYTLQLPYGIETIVGIEYSADEIIHYNFLENRWGMGYGRTPLASVINDVEIINRMERSIAVIAMYKAIPKKLLFPETTNPDEIMDDKAVLRMKKVLTDSKDYESPVVGAKFGALNLTDGGQALDLSPYLDYFKRKISMVLSPEFIVHGELVNRATSREQKQLFYLSVCALRDEFIDEIDSSTHEGLIASFNLLRDSGMKVPTAHFYFEFGDYDVELVEERMARMMNEWNNGLISLNEYRREMDYNDDEEYGGMYKWETGAGESPDQTLENIRRSLDGISQR